MQKVFYSDVLEFELVQYISGDEVSFRVGNSVYSLLKSTWQHLATMIFPYFLFYNGKLLNSLNSEF